MKLDITKVANIILYMLENKILHLNDKKLAVLLFLIEYNHIENHKEKIFGEVYIKNNRAPQPETLSEIFDIIANSKDLEDDDERLYIIQELLDHLDIEVLTKSKYIELNFIKMEEEFDKSLFTKDELKTISSIVNQYKDETPRKMANICFAIDKVRETAKDEIII
ncbi:MAG: DUF4065 domain-containing protein [Campylobacterota bacterium]|nr:DUF4065 domain-containing protein [Campylobacterota bacterium]